MSALASSTRDRVGRETGGVGLRPARSASAHPPDDAAAATLVSRAKLGDELAIAELYVAYLSRLQRYMAVALQCDHEAEEAAQHVFVKAVEALPRYEQRTAPFAAWLFRLARNHVLDLQRRHGRSEPCEPGDLTRARDAQNATTPESPLRALSERLAELPRNQRRVLMLRYACSFTPLEIAELIGTTADAVRHTQMRALAALATSMSPAAAAC